MSRQDVQNVPNVQANDDHLLKNVQDLRKRLKMTQRNLQQITAWEDEPTRTSSPLGQIGSTISTGGSSKNYPRRFSSSTPVPSRVPAAQNLDESASSADCVPQRHTAASTGSRTPSQGMSPIAKNPLNFSNNALLSSINSTADYDGSELRKKLQQLRQENSSLISDKHRLQTRVEDMDYELARAETRVRELADRLERSGHQQEREVTSFRERLESLQAEAEIQDRTLRDAESRYEQVQRALDGTKNEHLCCLEEATNFRRQLSEQATLTEKITRERTEALKGLDDLKANFHEYQGKVKERLKKLSAREKSLSDEMTQKDGSNSILTERISQLQRELADVREELTRHQAELNQTTDANDQYQQVTGDLRSLVDVQKAQLGKLRSDLEQRNLNEEELRNLVTKQRERLEKYKVEVTLNRNQLSQLELLAQKSGYHVFKRPSRPSSAGSDSGVGSRPSQSNPTSPHHGTFADQSQRGSQSRDHSFGSDVSPDHSPRDNTVLAELRFQLSMKDAEIESLRTMLNYTGDENANNSAAHNLNHDTSRRVADLENQLTRLEEERTNHKLRISQLETRVSDMDSELSSKSAMLRHRNNDLSEMQSEISNKHTELMSMEKELRRKTSKLSALERELDDKTTEQTDHVASVQYLRDEVAQKTTTVGQLRGQLDEKTNQLIEQKSLSDNIQSLHEQQCTEYERQIEMLQSMVEAKCDDIKQAERVVLSCKDEMDQKQALLDDVEQQLSQSQQTLELRQQQDHETLRELESLSSQSHKQLSQMEQALMVCRKEIQMYIDQLTEQERQHQQQLDAKQKQLVDLELRFGDLESRHRLVVSAHGDLESAYDRQETMLRESTGRIQELEDGQATLQKQLSVKEKEMSTVHGKANEELDGLQNKLRQSLLDLDDRGKHNRELMKVIEEMQVEKKKLSDQVESFKQDREQFLNETSEKEGCYNDLKEQMEALRNEREKKTEQVYDLEERLHLKDAECDKQKSRVREVDEELKRLQAEVRHTHDQLSQLQNVLTRSQERVSEQTGEITDLQDTLRESQHELLQRSQVCDELDQALKDRTWELEQRVTQIGHLDTTFKDQRDESEIQIGRLEGLLAQRQMDLEHRVSEISELVVKFGELQRALQNKELELQRHEINEAHLNKLAEEKCRQGSELEGRLEKLKSEFDELKMENRELQQELRLAREQHQKEHGEFSETRKQWKENKLMQDRMAREMDETLALVQTKDIDSARLAEELGAIRAHQSQMESRNSVDVRRLRSEMQQMKDQHQLQLNNLREDHSAICASKDQLAQQHRSHVAELQDTISEFKQRIEETNMINSELETQMHKQMETMELVNQSVMFKESEMAELRRKLDRPSSSHPTDDTNRLSATFAGPRPLSATFAGPRPRSLSPRRMSDVSKLTEYQALPDLEGRLGYLDMELDSRLSFERRLYPGRESTSSRLSSVSKRSRAARRESRSDFSGIFTASESEGEGEDTDSFVVMLKEVNHRFSKNRREDVLDDTAVQSVSEAMLCDDSVVSEGRSENGSVDTVRRGPVIRIPSHFQSVESP